MSAQDDPGVDGTPAWAYDEDGYCVSCGNGRWKHHMPECELRDALDAAVIVRDLADLAAPIDPEMGDCLLCGEPSLSERERERRGRARDSELQDHYESCPWRRAVEWVRDSATQETEG